jgi:hypothetical protein
MGGASLLWKIAHAKPCAENVQLRYFWLQVIFLATAANGCLPAALMSNR